MTAGLSEWDQAWLDCKPLPVLEAPPKWDGAEVEQWVKRYAFVPGPGGARVKFCPNPAQARALAGHPALRGAAGHFPSPKGRQAGWTTFWLLVIAALCALKPGVSILIVTPCEDPIGVEVLDKWRTLLDLCAAGGARDLAHRERDNSNETKFTNGSRVVWHHIGGSESVADSVGRGGTFDFCLLTEYGFPHDPELARRALSALRHALKRARAAFVYDSTPGEAGGTGEPYLEVIKGVRDGVLPGRIWFVGWWEVEALHNRAPLPCSPEAFVATLDQEERALLVEHGLALTQIQWRREEMAIDGRFEFLKANPERVEQLFDVRSHKADLFKDDHVKALRAVRDAGQWPEPLSLEELAADGLDIRPIEALGPGEGFVKVFAYPERSPPSRATGGAFPSLADRTKPRYFAGLDSSDGYPDSDWQCLPILDRAARLVALAHVRVHPLRYAAICQALLTYFGAGVRVERQHGETVAAALVTGQTAEQLAQAGDVPEGSLAILEEPLGLPVEVVQTGRINRPALVEMAMSLLVEGAPGVVIDQVILEQLPALHRDDRGRICARPGAHDDVFMALGLAGLCREATLEGASARPAPRARKRLPASTGTRRGRFSYLR